MQAITEYFTGGLVSARHAALLNPGELQRADDCVYREKSTAIHRAPGRTAYNSTSLKTTPTGATPAGIKGLAHLSFDQNTDQIIAWPAGDGSASYLYKSNFTGITGTFGIVTGPGVVVANTNSNTTISGAPAGSFTNMLVGAKIVGTGIPSGTVVTVVVSDTSLTISQAATASATVSLYFDVGIAQALADEGTETLDLIQWQSSYFMLPRNGTVNRLYWKQPGGTAAADETLVMRRAGLLPVTTFIQGTGVTTQTGPGWSSVLGTGYYWFLITEIIFSNDPKVPDVESGYIANEGRALVTQISAYETQFIRITFPSLRNDGANGTNRATHWGVYMSVIGPSQAAYPDNTNMPSAATFRRIATVDVSETTKDIKYTNTTLGPSLPTAVTSFGGLTQFTDAAGFLDRGVNIAFATSGGGATRGNELTTFGFNSGSPHSGYSVTGIKVNVVSSCSLNTAGYYLSLNNNGAKFSNQIFGVSDRTTMFSKEWGGQFDTWGVAWTPTDIGNLRVRIQKSYSSAIQILKIDYIEVTVYYSGAAVDTGSLNLDGPPYQVVTYRSQIGTTVNDPANYIIPSASTGDIFQGSLVLNDVSAPSTMRYSIPNAPESFPKPYFIKFDSRKKDLITLIRRIGQILVVGMRDSIKRVNYLPTEVDVSFGRGLAHEDIVTDHGIVGPLAATLFDLSGSGVVLGYVAYNGIYFTDGIVSRPLNVDIKLQDLVKSTALGTSILRVYPREKWLVFYYCPNGATHTKNTRAIVFNYAPDKIKEGGFLPATGPISISARSVTEANLSGLTYLLSGHQSTGIVYVEDSGDTQATGYQVHDANDSLEDIKICPLIRTRKMYMSGYERDARNQRVYILHDATGSTVTASSTTTAGSAAVMSSGAFGSVIVGMFVTGTGIPANTIVIAKADPSNITLNNVADSSGTNTLTFDNGTISTTVRGSGISDAVTAYDTFYLTTRVGDLFVQHHDNIAQGLELQIEKVVLPSGVTADLSQPMRLHNFTYLAEDAGTEMNRRE